MAAKPIERYVKKQIADQGGWPRILERIASGETIAKVSTDLKRPDGQPISRRFLSMLLHADPERSKAVLEARKEGASALVDDALRVVDQAKLDRDGIAQARVQADVRLRVAAMLDRDQYGERKQDVHVQVNVANIHLDALRHRMIENSRPLEQALADGARADFKLIAPRLGSSPTDRERSAESGACEPPLTEATA